MIKILFEILHMNLHHGQDNRLPEQSRHDTEARMVSYEDISTL